jgi:hypothetical protein
MSEKVLIRMNWATAMRALISVLIDGTDDGRNAATKELMELAGKLDCIPSEVLASVQAAEPTITWRYEEARLTSGFLPDTKWQIVFRLNGLDYCREPRPRTDTIEQVEAWVRTQCHEHALDGAEIQFW